MGKSVHDSVLDAALAVIATGVNYTFTSAEPANYAGIAAVTIASTTLTAGIGDVSYAKANGTSGRKLTIAAQTGLIPAANGTVTHACVDDGTTLLAVTTVTSQAVTTVQAWNVPAVIILQIADPT